MKPIVIFGDVHGNSALLRRLIDEARSRWGEVDLYSLGDLVDRGEDSFGVVEICVGEKVQGILGNHDEWFVQLLTTKYLDSTAKNPVMGGMATLRSYGISASGYLADLPKVPSSHVSFFRNLPRYRELKAFGTTYLLTHAGVKTNTGERVRAEIESVCAKENASVESVPDVAYLEILARSNPDELLWLHFNTKEPNLFQFPGGGVQVIGHTPIPKPIDGGHFIALDTGCGRDRSGSSLSAVVLLPDGSRTLFSVS